MSALDAREIYSDITTNLNPHPIKRTLIRKCNVDAVKQSIRNILLTNPGERLFKPDFGGGIRALLFENATPHTFAIARENIISSLENYEPRADVIDVVLADGIDEHTVYITVVFRIINIEDPVTLTVLLERIR